MTFSARWQEFEPVRMGQGFREGKLVNDIYMSFDEVDDFAMNSWSSEHLWETSPADGILGLFVRPPPSDDRVWGRDAYTEASLAGLADFAEELGWTSDSLVTQDYLSRSWGGFTMGGEVSLTEEGAAARAEDEALNDPSRSRYVSTVYATAYVMTGLRLSFDSEAQCKHDALLRLLDGEPGERSVYLLLGDEKREEIQRYLVAFGAKLHASVVSNRPRPELEAALSQSTCDAAHLGACDELLDNLERLRRSSLEEPAGWSLDYDALIQQQDPVYSIVRFKSGGRVSGVD